MHKRVAAEGSAGIDVSGWMGRATLEMLGQAGLGYSFDDFEGDSTDDYGESMTKFLYVPLLSVNHSVS